MGPCKCLLSVPMALKGASIHKRHLSALDTVRKPVRCFCKLQLKVVHKGAVSHLLCAVNSVTLVHTIKTTLEIT